MKKILIIHGPNLNLLGTREPSIYGHTSFNAYLEKLTNNFPQIELHYFQSNIEGLIIEKIQQVENEYDGILINAGAFSHTSIGIADALKAIPVPSINVHISNIYSREDYRKLDLLSSICKGSIVGLGIEGYQLALECLLDYLT